MEMDDSPTPVRQRSATVTFHGSPPPRPTDGRISLLLELGQALDRRTVPASFWACLQVADIPALRSFLRDAQASPRFCRMLADTFYSIPRIWKQNPPQDTSSSSQASNKLDDVPRSESARRIAITRDGGKCVITGRPLVKVRHIFPHYLLKEKPTDLTKSIPDIWKLLSLFFDHDRALQWKCAVLPNPDDIDSRPENLICLSSQIFEDWGDGYLAFKPINLSPDGCALEIEFHWLSREPHGPEDEVDLSKVPLSSAGLDQSCGRCAFNEKRNPIRTGDRFTLTTHNPDTHPLPSFTLLEMAWRLSQIVALSSAADDPELEDDDTLPMFTKKDDIRKWMSEPFDDDNEDGNDLSFQGSDDLGLSFA